ncbi:Protein kinase-like domain protein [Niveomyces insectorum RCEF 264]|uniref:Protein kinase-like domain protein n=1 Tax=Niveomyces insectorum RCEF 264 TaxID=1081102 RepID=A0A167QYJ4_9HYPO|nr:Protein kinase-like domain protein [Niveomyces insectorum RCEF 264]
MSAVQPKRTQLFSHARFDLPRLLSLAENLRQRPCACDESQIPKAGAFNWVIFLRFDDGVEWVFRAPRSQCPGSKDGIAKLPASEVATLRYIRQNTTIPVPEVFHYNSSYTNDIGTPYILMSKAPGRPLAAAWTWPTHTLDVPQLDTRRIGGSPSPPRPLKDSGKSSIMRQLGGYAAQLYPCRFQAIGSLFEEGAPEDMGGTEGDAPTAYRVGECLAPGLLMLDRETLEDLPRGPFSTDADYYEALVRALLLHAEQLPMGHHLFRAPIPIPHEYDSFAAYRLATDRWNDYASLGGKIDASHNRLQYSLAAFILRDEVLPSLAAGSRVSSGYPLCHQDLSMQNIFVDDDLHVTCLIDWAFCTTVPPAQLLAAPGLPHPRDYSADADLAAAYRAGFEEVLVARNTCGSSSSSRSRDGPPLPLPGAADWAAGTMTAHLLRLVNLDALQDYHHLEALCALTAARAGPDASLDLPHLLAAQADTPDAKDLAALLAEDDEPESEVKRRESAYFEAVGPDRLALARKITSMAERNPGFVADKRLWRHVERIVAETRLDGK